MTNDKSILSSCTSGGCGAKIGPGELSQVLKNIPFTSNDNLLIGFDSSDDAAVYKIDEEKSIISTVDFFSPMVDDPKTFGKIAATNALSDVYAMGGVPIMALNLVCFPEKLDKKILGEILAGGAEKIAEAGAVVAGGHSIYDKEPKYGLAVTGTIDTKNIIRNNTPKVGHKLILTKALGVGIVMAAARGKVASEDAVKKAIAQMERLNKYAAEKMTGYSISACTDITGFGFLAHLKEMCGDSVSACIKAFEIPIIEESKEYAQEYILTAAGQRNRNYFGDEKEIETLPFYLQEILFDPQTSGGLLIAVESSQSESLLNDIKKDDSNARIVGEIIEKTDTKVIFK